MLMKRVTVYVTDEQYEFLRKLKKYRVTMSGFLRGLLALHMYSKGIVVDEVVREREIVVVRERTTPIGKGYGELHQELMAELKNVLKDRKVD